MTVFSFLAAGATDVSPLFALLSLVLIFAVLMSLLLAKLKQNFLIGYLICGVIIANAGLASSPIPGINDRIGSMPNRMFVPGTTNRESSRSAQRRNSDTTTP